MSKLATASHRLADQDSNWRKPKSPALAIPGATHDIERFSTSQGKKSQPATSSGWGSFKRNKGESLGVVASSSLQTYNANRAGGLAASLEPRHRDASSADNWRSHHSAVNNNVAAHDSVPTSLGSFGSGPSSASPSGSHHRKHVGFAASSNAAEVARRAFVVSEIGSIGNSSNLSKSHQSSSPHKYLESGNSPSSLRPVVNLKPLKVLPGATTMDEAAKEDWAVTPTSTLPSLPTSPDGLVYDNSSTSPWPLAHKLPEPHQPSGATIDHRHAALDRANTRRPSPAKPSLATNSALHRDASSASPQRAPVPFGSEGGASALYRSTPPRLPTENLGKFRRDAAPAHSATGLDSQGNPIDGNIAARHSMSHSRRSSLTSNRSSPSTASVISARPAHGVYRPPHLRNRNSASGLKLSMAHYDRVRTPSLRGMMRSPEPPSRPGSTQPPATIFEDSHASSKMTTPTEALLDKRQRISHSTSPRAGGDAEAGRDEPGYFDSVEPPRTAGQSVAEPNISQLHDEEDLDLTHDDILQMPTSLTDSYCMSRRVSNVSSAFRVGNGVPVIDVFDLGDRLGPGMIHDGHKITIAETSDGFRRQQADLTGTQLEVVGKLGEGSYAVVYLVKEVAGNGQIQVGRPDADEDKARLDAGRGRSIATGQFAGHEDDADATVADTTLIGDNELASQTVAADHLDEYSSTLRAENQPQDSLKARVAAAEAAGADVSPPNPNGLAGINEPHEGRLFALKCLCKRDLSEDMLEVQRLEATIHQSMPPHANIVTLYRTYETPEWLFLVIEYCPGQDLFYWLEQAQDTEHLDRPSRLVLPSNEGSGRSTPSSETEGTPPSPSLLASTSGQGLLSRRRLRLISKMFRQMCEAVQFCHDRGVAHRDLKPENFIVEDRRGDSFESGADGDDASDAANDQSESDDFERPSLAFKERASTSCRNPASRRASNMSVRSTDTSVTDLQHTSGVVVKLTDFGLATAETKCQDFDCGSKPYMAYECRNNLTSYYDPQQADIWSLGVVLLNLIFHRNPFKEPSLERCQSFSAYCHDPIGFFTESFEGITEEMAEFLSQKVFCNVVPRPEDNDDIDGEEIAPLKRRVTAREFGAWVKDLPRLFGLGPHQSHKAVMKRGFSSDYTSPLTHSRAASNSSTLPSLLSSPHRAPESISEIGDLSNAPLFPEYRRDAESSIQGDVFTAAAATTTQPPPETPDILPSPTFSPPKSAFFRSFDRSSLSPSPSPSGGSAGGGSGGSVKETESPQQRTSATRATLSPPQVVVHRSELDAMTGAPPHSSYQLGRWVAGEGQGAVQSLALSTGKGSVAMSKAPQSMSSEGKPPAAAGNSSELSTLGKLLESAKIRGSQRLPSFGRG